jgi:hypothetical protein
LQELLTGLQLLHDVTCGTAKTELQLHSKDVFDSHATSGSGIGKLHKVHLQQPR